MDWERYGLKLISAANSEPVTAAEVKLYTHVNHSTEDSLINIWIAAGRKLAADFQRRAYVIEVWEMSFDRFPKSPIWIARAPLFALLSIRYFDYQNTETSMYTHDTDPQTTTTTAAAGTTTTTTTTPAPTGASNFVIDTNSEPGRVALAFGVTWPSTTLRPIDAVRVRFGAGYGPTASSVPGTVKDAIMLYCAFRYENRAGEGSFGVVNPPPGAAPKEFFALLEPDRMAYP